MMEKKLPMNLTVFHKLISVHVCVRFNRGNSLPLGFAPTQTRNMHIHQQRYGARHALLTLITHDRTDSVTYTLIFSTYVTAKLMSVTKSKRQKYPYCPVTPHNQTPVEPKRFKRYANGDYFQSQPNRACSASYLRSFGWSLCNYD